MNEEKIVTKHPEEEREVRISKTKYNIIKSKIIECLQDKELAHLELTKCANDTSRGKVSRFHKLACGSGEALLGRAARATTQKVR